MVPSAQSNLTNKSRLRLLHQREEHVQDLFATARAELVKLSAGEPPPLPSFLFPPVR